MKIASLAGRASLRRSIRRSRRAPLPSLAVTAQPPPPPRVVFSQGHSAAVVHLHAVSPARQRRELLTKHVIIVVMLVMLVVAQIAHAFQQILGLLLVLLKCLEVVLFALNFSLSSPPLSPPFPLLLLTVSFCKLIVAQV